MRLVVIIAIVAVTALPLHATEKISVEELEQILANRVTQPQPARHNASSPDEIPDISGSDLLQERAGADELAPQIAGMDLSERLSTTTMFRLIWKYHLGLKMQEALEQLSDRTALLKLPEKEKPQLPFPEVAAQQAMLRAARTYVMQELSHLPNFIATQTTTRFDDAPLPLKDWQITRDPGLHRVGSVQRQITFRDGMEVTEDAHSHTEPTYKPSNLESRGEFGTEAAVVLMDVVKGTIAFSHWEQTLAGLAAVYQYSVPRESSHYEVNSECHGHGILHDEPGYHGTVALDPKTGAIFRITLEADWKSGDPVSHVASVIEYGPVVLGHHRSICPLRSLVFMVAEAESCPEDGHKLHKPVTMINQTIFSNYHRFGSSSTIIFNQAENGQVAPGKVPSQPEANSEERSRRQPSIISGQNKRP